MYKGLAKSFRTNVLVGLVLVTPLAVTAIVVNWLFTVTTNLFLGLVPPSPETTHFQLLLFRLVSLVAVLILLFLVGLLIRNILGRRLYRLGDRVLVRIPLINKIYIATRQVIEAIFTQRQSIFQEVVMVEFPQPGTYAVAFVTATVSKDVRALVSDPTKTDYVTIFIPTTPNPTSGWLFITSRSKLIPLDMTTGDAMKLIISAGAVFPGNDTARHKDSLVDKLDDWIKPRGKSDVKKEQKKT